jgi:site-specific recombinase XerD
MIELPRHLIRLRCHLIELSGRIIRLQRSAIKLSDPAINLSSHAIELRDQTLDLQRRAIKPPRSAYLGDKARQTLRRYLREWRDHNLALWISRSEESPMETGLRMMLRRRASRAGVLDPSPQDFRRAFALKRWQASADILTLPKFMGHRSLQVLNRSVKQAGEDLEQAAKQTLPVDLNF